MDPDPLEEQTFYGLLARTEADLIVDRTNKVIERLARISDSMADTDSSKAQIGGTQSGQLDEEELEADVGNVIRFSAPRTHAERPTISIVAVQEWEGSIDSIGEDAFDATMVDVSADAHRPTERMAIPLSLIDEEDAELLEPGVIFRLVVGRERRRGGQIQNKTLVYIRRNQFRNPSDDVGEDFGRLMAEWS